MPINNNISDKCMLENIVKTTNKSLAIVKKRMKIANDILEEIDANNKVQSPVRNTINRHDFCIDFSDNTNIHPSDKSYIDYNLKIAKTPLLGVSNIPFNCKINKLDYKEKITITDKIVNIYLNPSGKIKDISIDLSSKSSHSYTYYVYSEDEMIASGDNTGPLNLSIKEDEYELIHVKIVQKEAVEIKINSIQIRKISHAMHGEITSTDFKLYNTSNIKVEHDSSGVTMFLGIKNNNKTTYIEASKNISISSNNIQRENIVKDNYEIHNSLRVITSLKDDTSLDSISLYKGYSRYSETLIKGAFVNDDISLVDFKDSDIIYTRYTDIDIPYREINDGDLLILSNIIHVDEYTEIDVQYPHSDDSSVKIIVLIDGRVIKNQNGRMNTFLSEGKNTLTIRMYKEKVIEKDIIKASFVSLPINFRKYSSLIYDKKLEKDLEVNVLNKFDDIFCINEKGICVRTANQYDSFLLEYEQKHKSEYHKEDETGVYIECNIKASFNGKDSFIKKIWIK